ncbi:hypothetical protein ACPV3S_17345 [Photobacterium damselae]|uniref:hypothetical protein n=1 Tax=Photobacterium damselae TaxID=38293 RepID=UPI004068E268
MALKPRKSSKNHIHSFLLNKKLFLKYLKGQYITQFIKYKDHIPSASFVFNKTKLVISPNDYRFLYLEKMLNHLTENGKAEYKSTFCSYWIVTNDTNAISLVNKAIYQRESHKKPETSKDKREKGKNLRTLKNELYQRGNNDFLDGFHHPDQPLTERDYKWWKCGYNNAKDSILKLQKKVLINLNH